MALRILWHDDRLIAIHKPAGWLVHRTGLDAGETRIVLQALREQLGGQHVWPLHRLDKGTCGVLLLALDAEMARWMGQAFAEGRVHKRYLARVRGWLHTGSHGSVEVDHPLRPDDSGPEAPLQPAVSRFGLLARWEVDGGVDPRFATSRCSLVWGEPLTGRRHQLRRHLKHLAHPILGDATHGKGPLNRWWAAQWGPQRLWLHAASLSFDHPASGQPVQVDSGLHWDGAQLCADVLAAADLRDWLATQDWLVTHAQRPSD
jgi:tRNA pseudouridine65 synthase